MSIIYVVTWRYSDGSGSGAVAAFYSDAAAQKLIDMLIEQQSIRTFRIEPVPFEAGSPQERREE